MEDEVRPTYDGGVSEKERRRKKRAGRREGVMDGEKMRRGTRDGERSSGYGTGHVLSEGGGRRRSSPLLGVATNGAALLSHTGGTEFTQRAPRAQGVQRAHRVQRVHGGTERAEGSGGTGSTGSTRGPAAAGANRWAHVVQRAQRAQRTQKGGTEGIKSIQGAEDTCGTECAKGHKYDMGHTGHMEYGGHNGGTERAEGSAHDCTIGVGV